MSHPRPFSTGKVCAAFLLLLLFLAPARAQQAHQFSFSQDEFLLDGKPIQLISGELHPARIPQPYWRHRIRMAKAMGCNTIALYVFWNYHESFGGHFNFTGDHDIAAFIRLCQEEGLWVLLRPGPYVCGEWDLGGLPSELLRIPDIKLRCDDPRYMSAVRRYVKALSRQVKSLQCTRGGPILMVQLENEYGSYANDRTYLQKLMKMWRNHGINVPLYTADGPAGSNLRAGSMPGCAVGLDPGVSDADFTQATKVNPGVPSFCSELYPGWLTHWGEPWQRPDTAGLLQQTRYLLEHKKSLNFYVIHGGTNFGFSAGANAFSPTQYQPDVTSYDYDAPIDEQGRPTHKYFALRSLIAQHVSYKIPEVPEPIPVMEFPPVKLQPVSDIWRALWYAGIHSPQPQPMESFGQQSGLILYRTTLVGPASGTLTITEPHDYALVFLNGKFVDTVYRDGGHWSVDLPSVPGNDSPVLDILVEGMGRINFGQYLIDRKGITDRVTLNGIVLTNWRIYPLSLESMGKPEQAIYHLDDDPAAFQPHPSFDTTKSGNGVFFRVSVQLDSLADTYLDMRNFRKGMVWVNNHCLGRYWTIKGPQQRLYCPATFLKKGRNDIIIFDLHQQQAATIFGAKTME